MLNFNEILNSVISGIICSFIVAISTIIYNLIKQYQSKNKTLFFKNLFFYFDIFSITFCAINFRLDKISFSPFSFGDNDNLLFFCCLIICIIFSIVNYKME